MFKAPEGCEIPGDWKRYPSISPRQIGPGSLIRLSFQGEKGPEFVELQYESFSEDLSGKIAEHWKPMRITNSSLSNLVGYSGFLEGKIRIGEPYLFWELTLPPIQLIEGQNIQPDELTPQIAEILQKHYRGKRINQMQEHHQSIKEQLSLSVNLGKDIFQRESIDLFDEKTKVGYLAIQILDEAEETGTLTMGEEEFLNVSAALCMFARDTSESWRVVKIRKASVCFHDSNGSTNTYEILVHYCPTNDWLDYYKINKRD